MEAEGGPFVPPSGPRPAALGGGQLTLPSFTDYSIAGVLNFLHQQWTKFERERTLWESERSELLQRVAILEGERRGHDNLKRDLVRRIKMLEYALRQERAKHAGAIGGTAAPAVAPPATSAAPLTAAADESASRTKALAATGREVLRRYLGELGLTDHAIQVRVSQAERSLESLTRPREEVPSILSVTTTLPRRDEEPQTPSTPQTPAQQSDASAATSAAADVDEALSAAADAIFDAVADVSAESEAMSDFDFLQDEDDGEGESSSSSSSSGEEDDDDKEKEEKEEKSEAGEGDSSATTAPAPAPARVENVSPAPDAKDDSVPAPQQNNWLNAISKPRSSEKVSPVVAAAAAEKASPATVPTANLKDVKSASGTESFDPKFDSNQLAKVMKHWERGKKTTSKPSSGKSGVFKGKPAEMEESEFNVDDVLGELASLSVQPEQAPQEASAAAPSAKNWKPKYTLRGHYDGVRALAFHDSDHLLLTASEDHTAMLWNLRTVPPGGGKKATQSPDIEPLQTYRGHTAPIFSLAYSPLESVFFSGSADRTVKVWKLAPAELLEPFGRYDPLVCMTTLVGHTDAIWDVSSHPIHAVVLSASADGSCRVWRYGQQSPLVQSYRSHESVGVPTSTSFTPSDHNRLVTSYSDSTACVYDIETGKQIVSLASNESYDGTIGTQINKIVCHPTLPMAITAHEDKYIRYFDLNSGKCTHSMVAHLDAVSTVAVDPSGLYLLSGGHDCSVRLWDIGRKSCVQEVSSHRKKFDEGVQSLGFHPSQPYIASGGADGSVKIYV
eukprot:Opistho-2@24065